ncbi:MAG: Oxygen regulatory protein NreC [Porticoccaceae bacterium UBA1117]|nr:MAG: Oxygen regulatory protein NreC [Porticoccaceae bacterium UBA1117]|tara:strand:- start:118 stop:795 length:678 start_codon:yes stop_codon:yes gene_type:complete
MHTLIVDDHAFVCVGLKATLLDGLSDIKVSTASDGAKALDILLNDSIDLAVIDLFMPGGDGGFDFIDTVCQTYPQLPIIVLSASENPAHIRKCLDIGAKGFVTKSAPKEILFTAITKVLAGDRYIPSALLTAQGDGGRGNSDLQASADNVTQLLTERQLEILALISKGLSNKLIARELFLSENTVKVHVSAILRALSLSNRTQAGLVGQKLEIIKVAQLSENGGL